MLRDDNDVKEVRFDREAFVRSQARSSLILGGVYLKQAGGRLTKEKNSCSAHAIYSSWLSFELACTLRIIDHGNAVAWRW